MDLNATIAYALAMGIEIACLLLIEVILLSSYFIAFPANAVLFVEPSGQVVVQGGVAKPIEVHFLVLFDAVTD